MAVTVVPQSAVTDIDSSSKLKKKKPKETAFNQQRLPAWKPIYTAGTVIPTFFLIGIAFVPIGIGMLWFSGSIKEKIIPYTNCRNDEGKLCKDVIVKLRASDRDCFCNVPFEIENDWTDNVYIFYALTNFYQNHRRYIRSRNEDQLMGKFSLKATEYDDCEPYSGCGNSAECCNGYNGTGEACGNILPNGTIYLPCGAIANSFFSDVITLKYNATDVAVIRTGIAWDTDKRWKFSNPEVCKAKTTGTNTQKCLKEEFKDYAKPKDWKRNLWELDTHNPDNNGLQNEDFIVWMRPAAFPNFKKLYRKINHSDVQNHALSDKFKTGIPRGNYSLIIEYNFEVASFNGEKHVVLSTVSLLGNKNSFLGIGYISVGGFCLLLGIIFLLVHFRHGKEIEAITSITPKTPYTDTEEPDATCLDTSVPIYN